LDHATALAMRIFCSATKKGDAWTDWIGEKTGTAKQLEIHVVVVSVRRASAVGEAINSFIPLFLFLFWQRFKIEGANARNVT
jgi:hypothetical protein